MEKGKGKPDDSLGNIYITYDVEMAQKDPFYLERWVFLKKESSRVSSFARKLHKHFGIHKNVFEMTLNMNNSTVNKYFDIPDNHCLSRDAIDRMAVCIILMEPPLNKNSEFIESCKKAGTNFQGVIPCMNDKDFENLRKEFCKAFGTFGSYLTEDVKSFEVVNNLNKFYFNKFNHKIQNYNDKQHN